jgi:hypothetical protein
VSKQIIEKTNNLIYKYGTTICFGGWDNAARHPLLNIMFVCPSDDVFIGSIKTTREEKNTHYVYAMHCLDTLKPLKMTTLYKFGQTML